MSLPQSQFLSPSHPLPPHAAEVLDLLPAAVYTVDSTGLITYYNRRAAELWGHSPSLRDPSFRYCGAHRTYASDGSPVDRTRCAVADSLADGLPRDIPNAVLQRPDGSRMTYAARVSPLHDDSGRIIGAINCFQDTSERVRATENLRLAEATIRMRAETLKLLSDNATRLLLSDRPESLLPSIFDSLCSHLHCSLYFNYLVSDDGLSLRLNAYSGVSEEAARSISTLSFGQALCGTSAQLADRIVCQDVQHNPDPRAALVRSCGVSAYACHPLLVNGKVIGTLSFGATDRLRFSPEDLDLMRTTCDQIAMALERSRLTAELQSRAQELTQANAAKDQFLAALSHELRTPLTPVLIAASVLEAHPQLPPDLRGDLAMIRRNIELEARLIDDLLDLTRITRGKLALQPENVDAHEIIRQTIGTCCGPDLQAKQLSISLSLDAPNPTVLADPSRLTQILWNLLKNATKFTPSGGSVSVRTANPPASAGSPASLRITVSDTGIGIAPDALPRIFDAFDQGDAAITRQFGGLGLGLAITKALVDLHGGSISASSDGPGTGASFTLLLPLATAHQRQTSSASIDGHSALSPAPTLAAPAPDNSPLRILLVEDHESTAKVLARLLSSSGHDVRTAHTVASALHLLRSEPFDLLISDLGLPDGTGIDLMRQLDGSAPRRAIALSGYGMDQDLAATKSAGFHAHLTKPVDLPQLQKTIAQVMAN